MSERAQRQQRHARRRHDEDREPKRDLRNEELAEDVACCLAEIDEVLDRERDERERARREFGAFDRDTGDRELNHWQAKYAHLGLRYGRSCCGTPYLVDPGENP